MNRLIMAAESNGGPVIELRRGRSVTAQEAVSRAAVLLARDLGARAIAAHTTRGLTARFIAAGREPIPLLAFTPHSEIRSQLSLTWGCETFVVAETSDTDEMVRQVDHAMIAAGRGKIGDLVVIVAGMPAGRAGNSNTLRVHRLGEPVGQ
ncbi:MAG: hypothetical protein HOP12_11750 [Candidatus Eisenbacteria bacterium]|uniref:Pyruvate kinase C-terminal domain-containing protein n=1 Tax=Eiseniibacteriota bacterium TaxID=2212470 RepID=A0A849T0H6_UNCEI|nr:hypothetical protein [Candidatus Eisenbacteria bacterium]